MTDEESQHIAAHSIIGEHILRPAINDEDILKMVRHHHERYDEKDIPTDFQVCKYRKAPESSPLPICTMP